MPSGIRMTPGAPGAATSMSVRRTPSTPAPPAVAASTINRRRFLIVSGAVVAATVATGRGTLARAARHPDYHTAEGTGSLSSAEMETLVALAEVLVPASLRESPETTATVLADATARVPGLLAEYRAGAQLLNARMNVMRGVGFGAATARERDALLRSILWRYDSETGEFAHDARAKLARRLERVILSDDELRLRDLVVRDVLTRLLRRTAWRLTGYPNYPGVPGDPRAYTEPPVLTEQGRRR
jgi:hypothetical protein